MKQISGEQAGTTLAPDADATERGGGRSRATPVYLVGVTALVVACGGMLFVRSTANANHVALADAPKSVGLTRTRAADYHVTRRYIGAVEPWLEAKIGPQVTSAYVDTVLVRPGASVKRGEIIATLDCREASAASNAVAMQARALEAQQQAAAHEAARLSGLLAGGFVSPNEAEQKSAETDSKQAQLLAARAQWTRASLQVDDCVLRAPFAGEITERLVDPGVFARPGVPVAVMVDRSMVRITANVPERDFDAVRVGTPVSVRDLATGVKLLSTIARRAPAADASTRTIHVELDVPNPNRVLPVRTTAELSINVGGPIPSTAVPLSCASVRGSRATLFKVDHDVAHKLVVPVVGESAGELFLARELTPGTFVVSEGRTLLNDADRVSSHVEERTAADDHATGNSPSQ